MTAMPCLAASPAGLLFSGLKRPPATHADGPTWRPESIHVTSEKWPTTIKLAFACQQVAKHDAFRWTRRRAFPAHRLGRVGCIGVSEMDDWMRSGATKPVKSRGLTATKGH